MDVRMPGMNGIQATKVIRERHPEAKVILFTADESRASIAEAIHAGVAGYLLKDMGVGELVDAARLAMQGKAVIHPGLTQAFVEQTHLVDQPPEVPLSPREIEILQQVASGSTTQEVADSLRISFHTVKTHLKRIFEKLGANDRAEAVALERPRRRRRPIDEGAPVRFCQEHPCCYEVALREVSDPTAGTWHFGWSPATRTWHLRNVRGISIERPVPESVAPSAALLGAIPGKRISHIVDGIEKLGLPPGCTQRAGAERKVLSLAPGTPGGRGRRPRRRGGRRTPG
jgi:DNA-binding NarL/FixJ family response regulator